MDEKENSFPKKRVDQMCPKAPLKHVLIIVDSIMIYLRLNSFEVIV